MDVLLSAGFSSSALLLLLFYLLVHVLLLRFLSLSAAERFLLRVHMHTTIPRLRIPNAVGRSDPQEGLRSRKGWEGSPFSLPSFAEG